MDGVFPHANDVSGQLLSNRRSIHRKKDRVETLL
jgi:hypothetical protein